MPDRLTAAPVVTPSDVFPDGVNVEFVVDRGVDPVADDGTLRIGMRVHERGVGETRSCGTGAVAAAWVWRRARGAFACDGASRRPRWNGLRHRTRGRRARTARSRRAGRTRNDRRRMVEGERNDSTRDSSTRRKGRSAISVGHGCRQTLEEAASAAAGLDDWQLYFLGRHGVLGDVDVEVIRSAAYVFPPGADLPISGTAARAVMTPQEATQRYLAVCHQWSRERLAGFAGADRLSELGRRVVEAADIVAMPLLAGWRALEMPRGADASAERCGQVCQLLREHRGACHGVALAALNSAAVDRDPDQPRGRGERRGLRLASTLRRADRCRSCAARPCRGAHR